MPRPCPQTAHRVSLEAYGSVGSNQPPRFRCHAPKGHRISAQGANPGNLPGNILRVLKERRIVAGLKPRPRPQPSFLFRHSSLPLSAFRFPFPSPGLLPRPAGPGAGRQMTPTLLSEGFVLRIAAALQIGQQIENFFFVQTIHQAWRHHGNRIRLARGHGGDRHADDI